MVDTRLSILHDPQLRPFLPLLYVAWADGELDDDELVTLRERLTGQPWVAPAARAALADWLDPARPPEPSALAAVLAEVRQAAATMDPAAVRTLVGLGSAMAVADCSHDLADKTCAALRAITEAMGMADEPSPVAEVVPAVVAAPRVPAFDVATLRGVLDGAHAAERAEVYTYLAQPEHRASFGLSTADQRALCHGWLQELARLGFGDAAFPGVTTEATNVAPFLARFEALAYGDLSLLIKFGVQYGLFGGSIFHLGSERHRPMLKDVASLALVGCFAMSETGHGSNVADIETAARYDADTDEFVIHTPHESARKDWIGGAATYARMATVFAQLEVAGERHGVHAFLVNIRDDAGALLPGVRAADVGHKMGLGGVDNGKLWFHQVRVPRAAMLDRFARVSDGGVYESEIPSPGRRFFTMLGTLVAGRVSIACAAVSVAKVGLTVAMRYAARRRQFGPPGGPETTILDYPGHQRRLLPALATTYALHFAVAALKDRYAAGDDEGGQGSREVEAMAAGLKAYASWHTTRTLQDCRECCGGQGYLSINRIPVLMDDSDVFTTFEGDNTVLMQLVAKSLLTAYKQQFAGARFTSLVRHVARRAATAVLEKNPIVTRITDPGHLRDLEFHAAAFRYREQRLLQTAALRIRKHLAAGVDGDEVAKIVQEHLLALAHAHVERVVFEAFAAGVKACADAGLRPWLVRLCELFALSRLEADMLWFVEDGYVEPWKARAMRKLVVRLCSEVRAAAVDLVDGFGIPDACLAAPIAFGEALT